MTKVERYLSALRAFLSLGEAAPASRYEAAERLVVSTWDDLTEEECQRAVEERCK
jgi:hypothetical protein